MRKIHLLFFTAILSVVFSAENFAQQWNELNKLIAENRAPLDYLGSDVDIEENYAVVSAPYSNEFYGNGNRYGSAYIFKQEGGNWVEHQQIIPWDALEEEYGIFFGTSVAINGDYIIIGTPYESKDANGENSQLVAGAAYIFKKEGDIWVQHQKIVASDRDAFDSFGASVAIDGDYAVVSSSKGESVFDQMGSAYIFKLEDDLWVQQQKILAPDGAAGDFFGNSVAIDNGYIIVGAASGKLDINGENPLDNAGAAYIFTRDGNIWLPQQKIIASDRESGDNFGYSVSIDGDNVVVGAYQGNLDANGENPLNNAGVAYIFKQEGNNWTQQQKIIASDRESGDSFGYSVSIDGDNIVVGAYQGKLDENGENPLNGAGAAYIFKQEENNWIQKQKIVASDREEGNQFATSLAIQGNNIILGSPYNNNGEESTNWVAGSAYIFELCELSDPVTETSVNVCSGESTTLSAEEIDGVTVHWYDSEEAEEPIFTGAEFETPVLTETTSYWVEYSETVVCFSNRVEVVVTVNPTPELTVENSEIEICEGTSAILTANTNLGEINWYDSAEATEAVFTGSEFTTPELTETASYWVEAVNEGCVSERQEIIVTVLPAPVLEAETSYEICLGSDAYLYAYSEGNVIFWYAEEDDTEYLYHGNNFIVEGLTEITVFWVEAYNLNTGCVSERIPVTVTVTPVADITAEETEFEICAGNTATLTATSDSTVNWYDTADGTEPIFSGEEFTTPILNATTHYWAEATGAGECVSARIEFTVNVNPSPDAPEAQPIQAYEEGMILADFEVEHTGTLHWYADEELTVELPDTTPVVIHTTYYVTQSLGDCESEATEIMADEFLNIGNPVKDEFAYYPNPVQDRLNFKGSSKVTNVQIFDMSGRLMIDQTNRNGGIEQLDVSLLPKGSYVVKAQTERGMKTFKIVKR